MIDFDVPQRSAENAESQTGSAQNSNRFIVDMASPETRSSFMQSSDKAPSVVSDSGQLLFNSTDIYGGAQGNSSIGAEAPMRVGSAANFPMSRPGAGTDGINTPATLAPSPASSETPTTPRAEVSPFSPRAFGAGTGTEMQAASAGESLPFSLGSSNGGTELSSASPSSPPTDNAQATPGSDAPVMTTASDLTPQQAAINQSVVELQTPMLTVNPDGTYTLSTGIATGVLFDGPNGQQIGTVGHGVAATGQDFAATNEPPSYAMGPTTVTYADGTQTTANVTANNTSLPRTNYVEQNGPDTDVAILTPNPLPSPLLPYPSLPLNPDATLTPGDILNAVGYGGGQLQGMSTTYRGMVSPADVANNTTDTAPMLATAGGAIHGMSGAPMVDSNGNDVALYTSGNSPTNGSVGQSLETPISALTTLSQSQSVLSPNWLYNSLNASPQPIASADNNGNSANQTFTGFTVTNGQGIDFHVPPNPSDAASPLTDPTQASSDTAPVNYAPVVIPPAVTPPLTDTTVPTPATDPTVIGASDLANTDFGGYYAATFGGDAGYGWGGGNMMTMDFVEDV